MANIMLKYLLFDKTNVLNRLEIEFTFQKHHLLGQIIIIRSTFWNIKHKKKVSYSNSEKNEQKKTLLFSITQEVYDQNQ